MWSHPEPVAAFAATNAGEAGANQRIGLCAGRYAAVRFRNWGVAELQHEGGDTFMGHQEILGTRPLPPLRMPFRDVIDRVEQALVSAGWQVERRGDDLQFLWVNQAVAIGDNLEADLGRSITLPPISL